MKTDQEIVSRIKASTQFVMALTALITSITALIKSCDKSVEKASYEELSASIEELQKQSATPIQIQQLQGFDKLDTALSFAPVSASASATPIFCDSPGCDLTMKTAVVVNPKPMNPAASAIAMPTFSKPLRPPPTWNDLVKKASD